LQYSDGYTLSAVLASVVVIQKASQVTAINLGVLIVLILPVATLPTIPILQGRVVTVVLEHIVATNPRVHPKASQVILIIHGIIMMLMTFTTTILMIFGIMKMPKIITMSIMMIRK
jgi:hypothetical protein